MRELIVTLFLFAAGIFLLLAALGLSRFPDLYCRTHAVCKAATIAKLFSFGAAAVYFWEVPGVFGKIALTIVLIFLTAPVGAHLIARAGYKRGARPDPRTWHDDYEKTF